MKTEDRKLTVGLTAFAIGTAMMLYSCGAFSDEGGLDPLLRVPPAKFLACDLCQQPIRVAIGYNASPDGRGQISGGIGNDTMGAGEGNDTLGHSQQGGNRTDQHSSVIGPAGPRGPGGPGTCHACGGDFGVGANVVGVGDSPSHGGVENGAHNGAASVVTQLGGANRDGHH